MLREETTYCAVRRPANRMDSTGAGESRREGACQLEMGKVFRVIAVGPTSDSVHLATRRSTQGEVVCVSNSGFCLVVKDKIFKI
jgi:hypothetical protein